jgi:hypothetical protein
MGAHGCVLGELEFNWYVRTALTWGGRLYIYIDKDKLDKFARTARTRSAAPPRAKASSCPGLRAGGRVRACVVGFMVLGLTKP